MKYALGFLILIFTLQAGMAYTASVDMLGFLEGKVEMFEKRIEKGGEPMREKILTTLEKVLEIAPIQNYRNIDQETFMYIINYLIDNLDPNTSKVLTLSDFSDSYDGFSVIQSPDQIVATVRNTGPLGQTNDDSFENLADFIFGNNSSRSEIAMTSPVTRTQLEENEYETAFIMPSGWTMNSLPSPNNDRITIKTLSGSLKAVRRFSGRVNKEKVDAQRAEFKTDLNNAGITRYGLPTLSQYDGPRVAGSARRNELWVELNE